MFIRDCVDVDCNTLCHIQGNPDDKVSDILFRNVKVQAQDPSITVVAYPSVKFENVTMNGKAFSPKAERLDLPEENEYDKL